MKTRTLLAATLAATLALAGCSKNDEPDGPCLLYTSCLYITGEATAFLFHV